MIWEMCGTNGGPENRLGKPVILITHTLPEMFAVTDRIIVMHRGRKVAEKNTADTNATEPVQYMVAALNDFPSE